MKGPSSRGWGTGLCTLAPRKAQSRQVLDGVDGVYVAKNRWWISTSCSLTKRHVRTEVGTGKGLTLSPSVERSDPLLIHPSTYPYNIYWGPTVYQTVVFYLLGLWRGKRWKFWSSKNSQIPKTGNNQRSRHICQLNLFEDLRYPGPQQHQLERISLSSPKVGTIWMCVHDMPIFISPWPLLWLCLP